MYVYVLVLVQVSVAVFSTHVAASPDGLFGYVYASAAVDHGDVFWFSKYLTL